MRLCIERCLYLVPGTAPVIPEVQVQAQLPIGRVGRTSAQAAGQPLDFRSSEAGLESDITGSVARGPRVWLTPRAGLRGELGLRGIGYGFEGAAAEWTAGLPGACNTPSTAFRRGQA